jgi:hypothetical protein
MSKSEKQKLEAAAVNWYLRVIAPFHGKKYSVEALDNQERPDAILKSGDGHLLGLEITHLYHDRREAEMIFGRSAINNSGLQSADGLIAMLNLLIEKKNKAGQKYKKSYPIDLVIRIASPIFTWSDFSREYKQSNITIQDSLAFREVWLLARDDDNLNNFKPLWIK